MLILSLQCWAASLNTSKVFVVEPFIRGSSLFGFNLGKRVPEIFYKVSADETSPILNSGFAKIDANDNTIRLRDIFSLNGWKDITRSHSFVPLVGWSKFIQNALLLGILF